MLEACPKCGTSRGRAEAAGACPSCGLRLDLWPTYDDRPTPDPLLDTHFASLDWEKPESHDAFLSLAQNAGLLDGAAARYRRALKDGTPTTPGARAQAQRALAQIGVLAVHVGKTSSPLSEGSLKILRGVSFVVACALVAIVGVVLWRTFGKGFSAR